MNAISKMHQTPKERLEYIASQSKPCPHEVAPRNYLTVIGLLVMVLSMIAVGIVGGAVGSEVLGQYARRIMEFIVP